MFQIVLPLSFPLFPHFLELQITSIWGFFIVCHMSLGLICIFHLLFFSLWFNLDIFYWPLFHFTHSFFCCVQSTQHCLSGASAGMYWIISLIIFFTSRTSIWFLCQRFMFSDEILSISSIFKHILQIIILKYIYLITSSPDLKVCFSVLFYLAFGSFGSVFSHSW